MTPLRICATVSTAIALAAATVAAPSAMAASSSPVDSLGRPTDATAAAVTDLAHNPVVSPAAGAALTSALSFLRGAGTPGAPLPKNAPQFTQFAWPTVAQNCIDGSHQAVATAIAVPGPADLPLPGVPTNHTSFVFTILGTGTVSPTQQEPLLVHWLNLTTGRNGVTPLSFQGINPDGPATVNGTADTGPGLVAAAITGAVTTTENGSDSTCRFFPTVAVTQA